MPNSYSEELMFLLRQRSVTTLIRY